MNQTRKIHRVLVANRGEIATRIAKTLAKLKIASVGLYVDLEKKAPYLAHFDQIYPLSTNQLSAFLHMDEIIEIARKTDSDAIHPGYGFLSENAVFAKKVTDAGLIWIGPSADVVEILGNKERAKSIAKQCKIPVLENVCEEVEEDLTFITNLSTLSYPLIVKPLMGGGGKGMQILYDDLDLPSKLAESRNIAKQAFGDGRLMAETYIEKPKHIEIQVLRDVHGNAFALGERDCTVQRRHQKIIEESPSVAISSAQREAMSQHALQMIQEVGYVNIGTVEFLLDGSGQHYFMEVNTRLQVEHVVTEMVYDVDLVACQIYIAQLEVVDLSEVTPEGHAIEVRVYAENPDVDFLPATGMISHAVLPPESGTTRVDHNIMVGQRITSMFDPLLLKLTVWGENREQAIAALLHQMEHLQLVGVMTNHSFIAWALQHDDFVQHRHHTQWVSGAHSTYLDHRKQELTEAVRIFQYEQWQQNLSSWEEDPWNRFDQSLSPAVDGLTWNQKEVANLAPSNHDPAWIPTYKAYHLGKAIWIFFDQQWYVLKQKDLSDSGAVTANENTLQAPMTGTVVKIHANSGDRVQKDQVLIEMEAMKMQYKLLSPADGTLGDFSCVENQVVHQDQILVEVSA